MSIKWRKENVTMYIGKDEKTGKDVYYNTKRPPGYVETEEEKPEPKVKCSPGKVKHNM
ncbi:hypothetical protein [Paenibacillus sp. 1P03SA]|uniref:hypothetical protein n=1 Tax=Paenibacillus sp. 1P03SA TaxID=3132294 RepID=UPI0039A11CC8